MYSEFLWSVFSHIRTEYEDLWSKSAYSVRMRENTDQQNSKCHRNKVEWDKFILVSEFKRVAFVPFRHVNVWFEYLHITTSKSSFLCELFITKIENNFVNPLSTSPTKWSNTLKQFGACCLRIV